MAKTDGIQEVDRQTAEVKKARRFDGRDWKHIADFVVQEWERRRDDESRRDREREWKEIDRQIAMKPSLEFKKLPNGEIDSAKKWMAETELPLQAQALEVLVSDTRRMLFADAPPWFSADALVTDELLESLQDLKIAGLEDPNLRIHINQDNVDKIVEGFLLHNFRQYDHVSKFDIINAESFKYGMGVGRGRLERSNVFTHEARGVINQKRSIPTIVPCSIKHLYLEEPKPTLHSSTVLGPAHIAHDTLRYENIVLAANKGSTDPEDDDGGWMPKGLSKVIPDLKGYVQVLEMEGDIVVPRKTVRSVVIPDAIVTVALGGPEAGGSSTRAVIRFRFRKYPFSSYLLFPYLNESADDAYPTSPLMKGRTVQQTATDATNRFLDAAMLKNHPPVGYDRNDMTFAQQGGPTIYPTAQWETTDPVKVYSEIGGDPSALGQGALQFINLYAQLTGVLPARLGAQTVSHTTAHAKEIELQRGATRTVDYVNQTGHGPVTRWLDMAYRMGRDGLKRNESISFFIESYGGFVEIDKSMLPDTVQFTWFGSGGPQEKQQRDAAKLNSLMMAMKVDQLRMSAGMKPRLNLDAAVDNILRSGGWNSIEDIINTGGDAGGPTPPPQLPGADKANPGAAVAALQNLSTAGA